MNDGRPLAVRTQYWQQPGKRAVVITDLAYLHGPTSGTVVLPHWLYWSPAGRVWNLDDPDILRSFYQTVLNQVVEAGDLIDYLDRDTLIAMWLDLWLPKGLRAAWEEYHPQLRYGSGLTSPGRVATRCPWTSGNAKSLPSPSGPGSATAWPWAAPVLSSSTASFTGPPRTSIWSPTGNPVLWMRPVQDALHEVGLEAVRRGDSLADLFAGFAETLIDLDVTTPDGQQTAVELVYYDRRLNTVTTDIGPVLHIEDALGSKVCARAGR